MLRVLSSSTELRRTTCAGFASNEGSVGASVDTKSEAQEPAEAVTNKDIEDHGPRVESESSESGSPDSDLSDVENCGDGDSSGYSSDNSDAGSDVEQENNCSPSNGTAKIKHEVLALLQDDSSISTETWKLVLKLLTKPQGTEDPKQQNVSPIPSQQSSNISKPKAKDFKGPSIEEVGKDKDYTRRPASQKKFSHVKREEDREPRVYAKCCLDAEDIGTPSALSVGSNGDNEASQPQTLTVMRSSIAVPIIINIKQKAARRHERHFDALKKLVRMASASIIQRYPGTTSSSFFKPGSLLNRTRVGFHELQVFVANASHDAAIRTSLATTAGRKN